MHCINFFNALIRDVAVPDPQVQVLRSQVQVLKTDYQVQPK